MRTPCVTYKGATAERRSVFPLASFSFRLMGPPLHLLESPSPPLSISLSLLNTHTPGWMTSLFRPGFLYDRGISRILQQTSPTADVVVHSAALLLSLSLSLSHSAPSTPVRLEVGGARSLTFYARGYLRKKTKKCTCFAGIVAISTVAAYTHQFFCAFCVANPSFSSHVRGSAVRRGENERIRSGQRCQSDVLQLRAAGHQLVLRSVAGEKTSKTWTDRQSEESGHRGRPNR